jgi:hypothetical protein
MGILDGMLAKRKIKKMIDNNTLRSSPRFQEIVNFVFNEMITLPETINERIYHISLDLLKGDKEYAEKFRELLIAGLQEREAQIIADLKVEEKKLEEKLGRPLQRGKITTVADIINPQKFPIQNEKEEP